jgi:ComF family protein
VLAAAPLLRKARRLLVSSLSRTWQAVPWRTCTERCFSATMDLLFPPICVGCGAELGEPAGTVNLCAACDQALRCDEHLAVCTGCGIPRSAQVPQASRCLECRRKRYRFQRVIALGRYQDELRQAAIRMKHFHEYPLTAAVGHLLADRVLAELSDNLPQVIVPIPKFWVKRVFRGTNTSEVLAETLGRRLRRPVAVRALRSRKSTRKQSLLGRVERQRNVNQTLRIAKGWRFDKADVLIVDDIMTTGATANEAARVLAQAGARHITVAVVARAVRGLG